MMRFLITTFALLCLPAYASAQAAAFERPDVIRYGATAAETRAALQGKCTSMVTRRIDPPFAPGVREEQLQIDCDGFVFFGAPRWAEFVIRDDSLEMVWIMVRDEDQDAIIAAMRAAYGPPSHQNADYIAFTQTDAAWRYRPAEVLFYSPAFEPWTRPWFE